MIITDKSVSGATLLSVRAGLTFVKGGATAGLRATMASR
jgi:hypothetical protein